MLHSQIIPALPRQKIKHVDNGTIAEVLWLKDDDFAAVIIDGKHDIAWLRRWQPVPEEPRPLRVGDKVKVTNTSVFTYVRQVRIAENGWPEQVLVEQYWQPKEFVRHATPSEIAQYFAPN